MKTKFDGSIIVLIGICLLQLIITVFTLTICTAWAICLGIRWYTKNSTIDGKRFYFDGTGDQLFGRLILWLLLTAVTAGIFLFWAPIKMHQWIVAHTHMEEQPEVVEVVEEVEPRKPWLTREVTITEKIDYDPDGPIPPANLLSPRA
jgi:uncharacterized membrane protein YjgN (DUF898 family)